jgi:DNA-binding LacI/PurR family transcriptional regulator
VVNDDWLGATLAVEHLLSLGHERIAHIHAGSAPSAQARRRAYETAMRRAGMAEQIRVVEGAFTDAGGVYGTRALLELQPRPTAIFAPDDLAAVGALREVQDQRLRVPDDVSVVGYDNIPWSGLRQINLTTVNQPRFEMGTAAVGLLLERVGRNRTTSRRIVRAPSLIVRVAEADVKRVGHRIGASTDSGASGQRCGDCWTSQRPMLTRRWQRPRKPAWNGPPRH